MTTTPLPPLPKEFVCTNGFWAYYTADQMQAYATAARADLEAENKQLREALRDCANQSTGPDWTERQALDFVKQRARAALKNRA